MLRDVCESGLWAVATNRPNDECNDMERASGGLFRYI